MRETVLETGHDNVRSWAERISEPRADVRAAAEVHLASLAKPQESLGRLETLAAWLAATAGTNPAPVPTRPSLVIFAGDHGVARLGVSAFPSHVTASMVRAFVAGTAAATVLARHAGVAVRVVDMSVDADLGDCGRKVVAHKIRRGTGLVDREDAMSGTEALQALQAGAALADTEVDAGADLLIAGDMGIGNTTIAAVVTAVLADTEVVPVVGRGTGIDDQAWMVKAATVRDACRRSRHLRSDPVGLMAAVTGPDIAAMTGFMLQAATRRTPVLLDGVVTTAAALLAHQIAPAAPTWMVAGHRSAEPAHAVALSRLGLEPLLDLHMNLGEGTGALAALPLLTAAARLAGEMATLDDVIRAT